MPRTTTCLRFGHQTSTDSTAYRIIVFRELALFDKGFTALASMATVSRHLGLPKTRQLLKYHYLYKGEANGLHHSKNSGVSKPPVRNITKHLRYLSGTVSTWFYAEIRCSNELTFHSLCSLVLFVVLLYILYTYTY